MKSFDDLMKVKGTSRLCPGYTDDDAFKWCIDSIEACLPVGRESGRDARPGESLGPHHALPRTCCASTRRSIRRGSGINLDTGNWPRPIPTPGLANCSRPMPSIVQAKTYHGGGVWYTLEIDYKRVARHPAQGGVPRLHLAGDGRKRGGGYSGAEEFGAAEVGVRLVGYGTASCPRARLCEIAGFAGCYGAATTESLRNSRFRLRDLLGGNI